MPVTLVQVDGLADFEDAKKLQGRLRRMMSGIRNTMKLFVVNKQLDTKVLSQPLDQLAMPELFEQALTNVSWAFDINKAMLTDAANLATAQEYRLGFYQDTVEPRGRWIANQMNEQVFNPMGMEMSFAFEELDIYQVDENKRAGSVSTLTNAIVTDPNTADLVMGILGYDFTEKQRQQLDELIKRKKENTDNAQNFDNQNVDSGDRESGEDEQEDEKTLSFLVQDLDRWMRKSIGYLKRNNYADCSFTSEHIPDGIRLQIARHLLECKTEDDIRAVFSPHIQAGAISASHEVGMLLSAIKDEVSAIGKGVSQE